MNESPVRIGVVVFPGSNCEQDVVRAFNNLGASAETIWHDDKSLGDAEIVVLPGGFAHGDYLRTGALARFSPIMEAVREHAESGGLVAGICNGFQVLCEAGLLPGALRKNSGLKFLCKWTDLRVENATTPFSARSSQGGTLRIPINHFEGNWYCDEEELESVRRNGQIVFTYADNPNGALADVAGLTNPAGNVLGMMPHPERATEALLGSEDGAVILRSMLDHVETRRARLAGSGATQAG
ncbi:MAG TPA: phosphoribosylformylglycinamidine synthase subunit PurQ [Actinomycetota bacterium]|nr:phosphoribosylformylglycinamidine synthase subunit PurQ [Actinomycetota bacterium]